MPRPLSRHVRRSLRKLARAFVRLPAWSKPPVVGVAVVLAILVPRVLVALVARPGEADTLAEVLVTCAAAAAAACAGGLVFGLARPPLARLGRPGDLLSGVVVVQAYLGALLVASPFVFERSAVPAEPSGWWLWIGLSTLVGLAAGHLWFGPGGLDAPLGDRAAPSVAWLGGAADGPTAALVRGWVRAADVAALFQELARLSGAPLLAEAAEVCAALEAAQRDAEHELALVGPPGVRVRLVSEDDLVAVEVLLEGPFEARAGAVESLLAPRCVDPLAA